MASGNKARAANQSNQQANQAAFNATAAKQLQTTPEQASVNNYVHGVLDNKGDWSANPFVNYQVGRNAYLKQEQAKANRGAYTMGSRYADPNMLALAGEQEANQASQADAIDQEQAVKDAQDKALNLGMQSAGLTAQRNSSVLSPTAQLTADYNNQFSDLSKHDFWADNFFGPMLRVAAGGIAGGA